MGKYFRELKSNFLWQERYWWMPNRKENADWTWSTEYRSAFDLVKRGLVSASILDLANYDNDFHVVCDASNFAIGCAFMQLDD